MDFVSAYLRGYRHIPMGSAVPTTFVGVWGDMDRVRVHVCGSMVMCGYTLIIHTRVYSLSSSSPQVW